MSEKHTPGPWMYRRLVDNQGKPYSTLYEAHVDLGPCMIWAPIGNEEQEANARLIADAPEMLRLLRECINDGLDEEIQYPGRVDLLKSEIRELLRRHDSK